MLRAKAIQFFLFISLPFSLWGKNWIQCSEIQIVWNLWEKMLKCHHNASANVYSTWLFGRKQLFFFKSEKWALFVQAPFQLKTSIICSCCVSVSCWITLIIFKLLFRLAVISYMGVVGRWTLLIIIFMSANIHYSLGGIRPRDPPLTQSLQGSEVGIGL